jgi:hypothetical protein
LLRQVKEMNESLSIQTILFILLTTLNVLNDTYRTLENYLILKIKIKKNRHEFIWGYRPCWNREELTQ